MANLSSENLFSADALLKKRYGKRERYILVGWQRQVGERFIITAVTVQALTPAAPRDERTMSTICYQKQSVDE